LEIADGLAFVFVLEVGDDFVGQLPSAFEVGTEAPPEEKVGEEVVDSVVGLVAIEVDE
jgi:hypothetical protein